MDPKLRALFDACKAKFPAVLGSESGFDKWYLVTASALVTRSEFHEFGQLYTYLIEQAEYASLDSRRALNRRFREFLMKQWVLIGAPKAATALLYLIKEERKEDRDLEFTKSEIQLDNANHDKGAAFLRKLHGDERIDDLFQNWGPNFEWLITDVTYGMFYADERVLSFMELELITYTVIACEDLPITNHLKSLERMGLSVEEIGKVTECGELVAKWAGDEDGWPDLRAMVASLNGKSTES